MGLLDSLNKATKTADAIERDVNRASRVINSASRTAANAQKAADTTAQALSNPMTLAIGAFILLALLAITLVTLSTPT